MAHDMQLRYVAAVKAMFPGEFGNRKVVEIGSLDINGSIRKFFTDCYYVGVDVAPGPGVDVVSEGQAFSDGVGTFDMAISCECFEHNPHYLSTLVNMAKLCRPGGLVLVSCATTWRAEHGTARSSPSASPLTVALGWNYYRNLTENDFSYEVLEGLFSDWLFLTSAASQDLYFLGITHFDVPNVHRKEQFALAKEELRRIYQRVNWSKRAIMWRALTGMFGERGAEWARRIEQRVDSRREVGLRA